MLQVGEKTPDPRRQVLLEHVPVGTRRRRQLAIREPRHDFAQDRCVILRLAVSLGAFDAEPGQMRTQARQWPLVQESREIIRSVREKFAAPEPDEEVEIFAFDAFGICQASGLRDCRMDDAERA